MFLVCFAVLNCEVVWSAIKSFNLYLFAAWKKNEHELSDDVSSDSFPNTPTVIIGKGKFSYPKTNQLSSSKADACEKSPLSPKNPEKKSEMDQESKNKKKDPKKSEKYKDAVIYRQVSTYNKSFVDCS